MTQAGQSLFEVVLAVTISVIIVTALVSLASDAVRNTTFSKSKTISARLNQEIMEWLRSQRDVDWSAFLGNITGSCTASPHTQCFLEPPAWGNCANADGSCIDKINGFFERKASFICREISEANPDGVQRSCNNSSVNAVEVSVIVSWKDAQGLHETKSSTVLTSW